MPDFKTLLKQARSQNEATSTQGNENLDPVKSTHQKRVDSIESDVIDRSNTNPRGRLLNEDERELDAIRKAEIWKKPYFYRRQ